MASSVSESNSDGSFLCGGRLKEHLYEDSSSTIEGLVARLEIALKTVDRKLLKACSTDCCLP
jgi:hypothetical protein